MNLFPTAANHMSFDKRDMSVVGQWPIMSRMPERYDRIVCDSELLLRNAIAQRIAACWGIAPDYHLPDTPQGSLRIGKPNEPDTQALSDLEHCTPDGTTNEPIPAGSTQGDTQPAIGTAEPLLAGVTAPNDDAEEPKREIIRLTQTQSEHNSLISPNIGN